MSFGNPNCGPSTLNTFQRDKEMEDNTLSQVIEAMYVGALLMIGGAIERHKQEKGTVMLLISDIEQSGEHWTVSMGISFVKQITP